VAGSADSSDFFLSLYMQGLTYGGVDLNVRCWAYMSRKVILHGISCEHAHREWVFYAVFTKGKHKPLGLNVFDTEDVRLFALCRVPIPCQVGQY